MAEWPSGVAEFHVTAEVVDAYANALGVDVQRNGVPAGLASVFTYAAVAAMPIRAGVVLTSQSFDFHRAAAVDDLLRTTYRVVDEYERKGRRFMTIETRTVDQDDRLVVVGRITRMMPPEGGAAV